MFTSIAEYEFAFTAEAIVLRFNDDRQARHALRSQCSIFAKWAKQFDVKEVQLHYPNKQGRYFQVLASMADEAAEQEQPEFDRILSPGVHFDRTNIPLPVLRTLLNFVDRPDEKWVLLRLSQDLQRQTQIAMTEACRSLVKNASLEQALGRQRQEYWHLPDLEELNQQVRQRLEPNNPDSAVEFQWRGVDVPTRSDWRRFNYRYWLIEADGQLFQVGQNIGVEQIKNPIATPATR